MVVKESRGKTFFLEMGVRVRERWAGGGGDVFLRQRRLKESWFTLFSFDLISSIPYHDKNNYSLL